jgi:hypothetical protein
MLRTFVRRYERLASHLFDYASHLRSKVRWQATSLTMLRTFVRRYERLASHLFDYASHLCSKVRTAGKPPLRLCFEPLFEGTNGWQATSLTMLRTFVRRYERLASHLFDYFARSNTNGWQATSLTMLRTFVRRYENGACHSVVVIRSRSLHTLQYELSLRLHTCQRNREFPSLHRTYPGSEISSSGPQCRKSPTHRKTPPLENRNSSRFPIT